MKRDAMPEVIERVIAEARETAKQSPQIVSELATHFAKTGSGPLWLSQAATSIAAEVERLSRKRKPVKSKRRKS